MRAGELGDFAGGFLEEFVDEGLVGFGLLAAMRRSWRSSCGAMRMAMSCFAFPEAGRPTLRARRSSAAVDSGMSERSSLLSGIGLALFAGRLARADDANDFLGMVHLSGRLPGRLGVKRGREIPRLRRPTALFTTGRLLAGTLGQEAPGIGFGSAATRCGSSERMD